MFKVPGVTPSISGAAPKSKPREADGLGSGEGRKLVVMCVLLAISGIYVLQLIRPKRVKPPPPKHGRRLDEQIVVKLEQKTKKQKAKAFVNDPSVLKSAKDFQIDQVEDEAYHYVLNMVHSRSPEEMAAAVEKVPYKAYKDKKGLEATRGKTVRVVGRLLDYWQRVLDRYPNPSGLAWIWEGVLKTDTGLYMVAITDKQIEPAIGHRYGDAVEFEGVFIKAHAFSTNDPTGKRPTRAYPYLVGRSFRRVNMKTYEEAYPRPLASMLLLVVLALLAVGGLIHLLTRRGEADKRERRNTLARKRLERSLKQGKAAAVVVGGPVEGLSKGPDGKEPSSVDGNPAEAATVEGAEAAPDVAVVEDAEAAPEAATVEGAEAAPDVAAVEDAAPDAEATMGSEAPKES